MSQPKLTPEQRDNLARLAAYLRTLPVDYGQFHMGLFSSDGGVYAHVVDCGAVACAVGHGPQAGVLPQYHEDWSAYADRVFGGDAWWWCFDSQWAYVDDTPHGAAARIEWMLANGIPEDAGGQRQGEAPLCYTQAAA